MLIYHPTYDAYHCVFRLIALIESIPEIELDMARLLDFYLLFPASVAKIKLPAALKGVRKSAVAVINVYHDPSYPASTFREMKHIQESAMKCLAASGLVDLDKYKAGLLVRTDVPIPNEIAERTRSFLTNRGQMASVVLNQLSKLPLRGAGGLKDRSMLMDYRYDVV